MRFGNARRWWAAAAAVVAGLGLACTGTFWRSPSFVAGDAPSEIRSRILGSADLTKADAAGETTLRVEAPTGAPPTAAILVFGAVHTRNPSDSQLVRLRQTWAAFKPTVTLVEGRLGFLVRGAMDPVKHYGEAGATAALAKGAGVKLYTWEPTREDEARLLLEHFSAQRVALFLTLRPYFSAYRFGRPKDPERVVEKYRASRAKLPGLEGALPNMAAIDSLWRADFAGHPDWRETSDEFGLPGYLAALSDAANRARDEHLVGVLVTLAARGERVFATVGRSHVPKIRPAIAALAAPRQTP